MMMEKKTKKRKTKHVKGNLCRTKKGRYTKCR